MAKVIIKKSDSHGKGIFSLSNIKKGRFVFRFTGKKIDIMDPRLNPKCMQVSLWQFICPDKKDIGYYLNHSCDSNCYVVHDKIIAKKDIKPGEEITIDYSLATTDTSWFMKCGCKRKNCRKVIKSFQKNPAKFKKNNKKYAALFIKEFF